MDVNVTGELSWMAQKATGDDTMFLPPPTGTRISIWHLALGQHRVDTAKSDWQLIRSVRLTYTPC